MAEKRATERCIAYFRFLGSDDDDDDHDHDRDHDHHDHDHDNDDNDKNDDDDKPLVTYNDEICPICLGAPKIGVKASCGHLLCAECLASYCDVTIKPAPLPCPLCRAPLNSITLACDFVSITFALYADQK